MKMSLAPSGLTAILFISVCLPSAEPGSQKSFLNGEAILAGWQSTYAGIRTMRVSYVHRLTDYQPLPDKPAEQGLVEYEHVERIEHGKRYHMRYSIIEEGFGRPEKLIEQAFNGKNTQVYWGATTHGSIVPGLTGRAGERTNHLKTYMLLDTVPALPNLKEKYPDGIPKLARILLFGITERSLSVRPDLEFVAGQLCHVIEVTGPGRDHKRTPRQFKEVLWIAHDRGMCLMKYKWYWDDEINNEFEVERITAADMDGATVWYPQKAHKTMFDDKTGTRKYELTVTDFVPNVEVNEDTFRFDFPPGTDVHDRVLGLSYVVGGAGPGGEVSRVSIVEPAEEEQPAKQATGDAPDMKEWAPNEQGADSTEAPHESKEQDRMPVETASDESKILGMKTLSILGVVVLGVAGLMFWRKRSATT